MTIKKKKIIHDTSFLTELILLRNDHELINKILPLAEAGNPHAQYAVGLIYAEGRGVKADRVQAYIWLSRAISQGDNDSILLRDVLMNEMSQQDIALAEKELTKQLLH